MGMVSKSPFLEETEEQVKEQNEKEENSAKKTNVEKIIKKKKTNYLNEDSQSSEKMEEFFNSSVRKL